MKMNDKETSGFKVTDKFAARALELLDESQVMQFAEGLRLNNAVANVFAREHERIIRKYGADHPRSTEMKVRVEASAEAKTTMYARYTEAVTPQPEAGDGWAVDGFVRTADGEPAEGVTVAAYDRQGRRYRELGQGCSDKKGYFSMLAEKIPDKELRVFMRASYGEKMLKSNENPLAPATGRTDRIEIIVEKAGKDDCVPPAGDKGGEYRAAQSAGGKTQPRNAKPAEQPVKQVPKEKTAAGVVDAIAPKESKESKGKAIVPAVKNLKEEGPKPKPVRGAKGSISKKRGK